MGFWSSEPKDHIKFKDIKKMLKAEGMHLDHHQQEEALKRFEETGRESFSAKHVKEVMRMARETTGGPLQSSHKERIERTLLQRISEHAHPAKAEAAEAPKPAEPREYRSLPSDHVEVPKQNQGPTEPTQEHSEDGQDKAA